MPHSGAYPEIWIRGGREGMGSRLLSSPFPSPPIPLPPLPLEVGPLNPAKGSGGALYLVHFSLKICHLVATILVIFPRVN